MTGHNGPAAIAGLVVIAWAAVAAFYLAAKVAEYRQRQARRRARAELVELFDVPAEPLTGADLERARSISPRVWGPR